MQVVLIKVVLMKVVLIKVVVMKVVVMKVILCADAVNYFVNFFQNEKFQSTRLKSNAANKMFLKVQS